MSSIIQNKKITLCVWVFEEYIYVEMSVINAFVTHNIVVINDQLSIFYRRK